MRAGPLRTEEVDYEGQWLLHMARAQAAACVVGRLAPAARWYYSSLVVALASVLAHAVKPCRPTCSE